jgi:hypothetical protein
MKVCEVMVEGVAQMDEDRLIARIFQKSVASQKQASLGKQKQSNEKKMIKSVYSPSDAPEIVTAKLTPTFRE